MLLATGYSPWKMETHLKRIRVKIVLQEMPPQRLTVDPMRDYSCKDSTQILPDIKEMRSPSIIYTSRCPRSLLILNSLSCSHTWKEEEDDACFNELREGTRKRPEKKKRTEGQTTREGLPKDLFSLSLFRHHLLSFYCDVVSNVKTWVSDQGMDRKRDKRTREGLLMRKGLKREAMAPSFHGM
jgi:hypothetical protein